MDCEQLFADSDDDVEILPTSAESNPTLKSPVQHVPCNLSTSNDTGNTYTTIQIIPDASNDTNSAFRNRQFLELFPLRLPIDVDSHRSPKTNGYYYSAPSAETTNCPSNPPFNTIPPLNLGHRLSEEINRSVDASPYSELRNMMQPPYGHILNLSNHSRLQDSGNGFSGTSNNYANFYRPSSSVTTMENQNEPLSSPIELSSGEEDNNVAHKIKITRDRIRPNFTRVRKNPSTRSTLGTIRISYDTDNSTILHQNNTLPLYYESEQHNFNGAPINCNQRRTHQCSQMCKLKTRCLNKPISNCHPEHHVNSQERPHHHHRSLLSVSCSNNRPNIQRASNGEGHSSSILNFPSNLSVNEEHRKPNGHECRCGRNCQDLLFIGHRCGTINKDPIVRNGKTYHEVCQKRNNPPESLENPTAGTSLSMTNPISCLPPDRIKRETPDIDFSLLESSSSSQNIDIPSNQIQVKTTTGYIKMEVEPHTSATIKIENIDPQPSCSSNGNHVSPSGNNSDSSNPPKAQYDQMDIEVKQEIKTEADQSSSSNLPCVPTSNIKKENVEASCSSCSDSSNLCQVTAEPLEPVPGPSRIIDDYTRGYYNQVS